MRIIIGVLCTSLWLLYAGQVLSVLNYGLAVRLRILGLREQGVWTGTPRDWLAARVIFLPVIVLSGVAIALGLAEVI